MKRVVINVVTAFIFMLIQTNFASAFGSDLVCQFGVIAIVLSAATTMNIVPSAVAMLIFALLCDIFVSGPVGIYAFCLMVVFALSHALLARFKSERTISIMIWSGLMTIVFELLLACVYSGIFKSFHYFVIFLEQFWKDVLITALLTPVVMYVTLFAEKIFTQRRTSSLV